MARIRRRTCTRRSWQRIAAACCCPGSSARSPEHRRARATATGATGGHDGAARGLTFLASLSWLTLRIEGSELVARGGQFMWRLTGSFGFALAERERLNTTRLPPPYSKPPRTY